MRIILIGPPGSGKGTQAQWMSTYYGIAHLSTGNLLRHTMKEQSLLAQEITTHLNNGQLVNDALVMQLITTRIQQKDCLTGFLLDGFPRTLSQMKQLHALVTIDAVIAFNLADEAIIKRFSGRRIHPESGRTYHIEYNPPKRPGIDDITQEPLIQRSDDSPEVLKERLIIYHQHTQPVMQHYRQWSNSKDTSAPSFYVISQDVSIEEIHQNIRSFISNL